MKRSSPQKKFGMGYDKMHGFHGNLLYDSRDWGYAYKFNHIWGSTYHRTLKITIGQVQSSSGPI